MREVLKWKLETVLATVFSSLDFSCNNKPFFSENRHYTIIQTDKRAVIIMQDLKGLTYSDDRDIKEMPFNATYHDFIFKINE